MNARKIKNKAESMKDEIQKEAKKEVAKAKKIVKRGMAETRETVTKEVLEAKKIIKKEMAGAKKEMEKIGKEIEGYIKNNPEKAAAISAGIGAALGTATALLLDRMGLKKKDNRRKK